MNLTFVMISTLLKSNLNKTCLVNALMCNNCLWIHEWKVRIKTFRRYFYEYSIKYIKRKEDQC